MQSRRPEFDDSHAMMSASEGVDANGFGASRVGAELRAARLRLGWTLEEVANGLRIRLPFLEAIEEGRIGDLPGSAYAVGFVRTYANSLGLDPEEIARRFRAEGHEVNRKTELAFPAPVPERGVPAGAVVLLGLILAIGAYAAWYKFSPVRHDEPTIAAVPERLAPLAERVAPSQVTPSQVTPSHVSPQVASILPPVTPSTANGSTPIVALPPAPPPITAIPVPVPVPVTLTPTAPSPPAANSPAPDGGRVQLKFKADSYVQVREKGGPVLLNRVMRAGEAWPVPKQANLVMTTGNAGGTDIVVDGIAAASLGASGAVRRDVSLEPDAVKLPPGVKLPAQPRQQ